MVREFWINDGRVFKNEKEAAANYGEVYKTIYPIHVIAKQDLQPLVDELKYHLEYMTVNNAHRIAEAAQELVEAWEGSNDGK